MPHYSQGLYFPVAENLGKTQPGHPNEVAKCRWGRLNAGAVAENLRLSMRSVVNLVRSQLCHTERPRYLFAARRAGLSETWLILVKIVLPREARVDGPMLFTVFIHLFWRELLLGTLTRVFLHAECPICHSQGRSHVFCFGGAMIWGAYDSK